MATAPAGRQSRRRRNSGIRSAKRVVTASWRCPKLERMDEPKQKRTRVESEEWAKRVERRRDSGLTTAEFAAELGINPKTLSLAELLIAQVLYALPRRASGRGCPNAYEHAPVDDQGTELLRARGVQVRSTARTVAMRVAAMRDRANYFKNVLLPARQRILNQTQLQFNAMNLSVFQLLLAKRDQVETARLYVEALRDHWLARAEAEQLRSGRLTASAAVVPTDVTTTSRPAGHL
jgi:hypothetical protein